MAHAGPPERIGEPVELSTVIAAPAPDVWRALTTPALTERWMGAFRLLSSWEVGAPLAIVGQLNGHDYAETGTVLAAEAPTLLRYDHWSRLWRVPDEPGNRAVMTIRLAPDGDATRISLRHELPAVEAIRPHARFFWTVALDLLRQQVEADRRG